MDPTSRSLVTLIFISIFATVAVINAFCFIRRELLHRNPSSSVVPLIGGIVGCYGFGVAPWTVLSSREWLPLFLDIGSLPWIGYCLWKVYLERRRSSNP